MREDLARYEWSGRLSAAAEACQAGDAPCAAALAGEALRALALAGEPARADAGRASSMEGEAIRLGWLARLGDPRTVQELLGDLAAMGPGAPAPGEGSAAEATGGGPGTAPRRGGRRAIDEQLSLLRMAVSKISDMVVVAEADPLDAMEPRIVYVNEAFERRMGYALAEVAGKTMRILQGPKTDRGEVRRIVEAMRAGEPARAELVNYGKDGSELWVEIEIAPIHGEGGALTHWVGVERDVSGRKAQELLLRASQARLRAIIENEPQCVKVFDEIGELVEMNAAGLAMCEAESVEQIRRAGMFNLIDGPDREPLRSILAEGRAGRARGELRYVILGLKGGRRLCHAVFSPLCAEDGSPGQVLAITRDVTEEVRSKEQVAELNESLERKVQERTAELVEAHRTLGAAQEQLIEREKLSALGGMVSGLAHELNTPLGNALLMSSTLSHKVEAFGARFEPGAAPMGRGELRAFMSQVGECSQVFNLNLEKAAALVSSFKQVAVDRVGEHRRGFKLADLARDVVLTMSPTIKAAKCAVRMSVDPSVEIDGFPGKLGQMLSNLIENAVIHGFEGMDASGQEPAIELSAKALEGGEVEIVVSDNGRGVDPQRRRKVFDPFFSTREGRGGSGLGLHIVRSIVVGVLGGSIDLAAGEGAGASFVIRMPAKLPGREGGPA